MNKIKKQYLVELLVDIPNLDPDVINKAKEDDSFAQLDIGEAYCLNTNLIGNYEKAFYWLSQAGEQRNTKAQFILGDLYALDKGTEKNEFIAYQWYMKSAIQGYPKALTRLHNLYHAEKGMYCRGQRNADEEEWTQPKFKEQNKIRELFEYRVEQTLSELTKTKEYFKELLDDCRKQNTTDAYLTLGFLYQHGYGIRKIISRAIEFYRLAAEEGSVDAKYNLARIYHTHHHMKWNYREAFKWYTQAAESRSIYAQSGLAFLYQHALGAVIDYSKTIYWYTQAAERRNVKAQISLGYIYRKGEIADQNETKAKEWYKRATKEGSLVAQNCLDLLDRTSKAPINNKTNSSLKNESPKVYFKKGLCSKLRDDVDTITEPAKLKELQKLASNAMKKDGNAMLEIGLNYYHGYQFKQDKDTAFKWIRKAAKAELVKAQCLIAEIYKNGDCVEQDYLNSSIWYTRAAKNGDIIAQYHLGQMYYQGLGVRKDPLEASRWYTLAAEKKHGDAQFQLGFLREKGEGLRQDVTGAIQIYTDLAKEKHPGAIYRLAIMYESGNKIELNFQKALLLYKRAAFLGSSDAQLKLGQLHSYDKGQIFSFENAFKYYKMAADKGHPEAKYRLAILYLDGTGVQQNFIQAYNLFNESKELRYQDAENIFHVPIDYRKNTDINYNQVVKMFKSACKYNFSSLEYNLGFHYEHETMYAYKWDMYTNDMKLHLAKIWYEAAASKNNTKAQFRLGFMYETGKGVSQDWIKALEHYELAQKNGNTDAVYRLAHMYLNGNGVSQDIQMAFELFLGVSHKSPSEVVNLLFESYKVTDDEKALTLKKMLEEIAESGNTVIQYQLGLLHINTELSNDDNVQEGIKWFLKASKGGYIDASYQLGILYEEGKKVPQNYEEATRLYQNAADKGHENALYRLAQFYQYGNGIHSDYLKAFKLYTEAAKHGNQLARLAIKITSKTNWEKLKNEFEDIRESTLDYSNCLHMWKYVADTQNSDLQFQLGKAYEDMGSDLNLIQAKEWYFKAAECYPGPSLFCLGRLFELGLGVKQDCRKSIELYIQSAMTGNNDALCALGNIYQHGKGVESSISKAFRYYKSAAENGDSQAQFMLGTLYEKEGMEGRNFLEAIKWFSVASSQGSDEAHSHLRINYENDISIDQFDVKSLHLLSKLIKLEENVDRPERSFFRDVYYRLGCMYFYGYGTSIDYEKSWQYFEIAQAKYGENRATIFLNIDSKDQDSSMKAEYLKRLEMWETVASHLKTEELYELGIIYYYGVYENIDGSKSDKAHVIVVPNTRKSVDYFKMVTDSKLRDENQYYRYSSYYLGMIHYVVPINREKALYYLYHALLGGYPAVRSLLKSINRNENTNVYKELMSWHQENQSSNNPNIAYNIGYIYSKSASIEKDDKKAFKYYKKAATQGHSDAQKQLGKMYLVGDGVEKDVISAVYWYKKAVKQNHSSASYNLGTVYYKGYGREIEKDYNKAFEYFKIAADQGHSDAQSTLGYMFNHGYGTEADAILAIQWYKKAAKQKNSNANSNANSNLGDFHFYGRGVEKDYNKAFEYYKIAADQRDSGAQKKIAHMYNYGYGTKKDVISAIQWYKKASDQNDIEACYSLGAIYYNGEDVEKDYTKAFQYYKIAAKQGHSKAQFQLGYCYFYGRGCDKDEDKGLKIMEEISNKSDFILLVLGEVHHSASPNYQNFSKALRYYQKVSTSEEKSYALRGIGLLYEYGDGVEQNYQEALAYYQKAAVEQNIGAYYNIALLYYNGTGVNKDYTASFGWFTKVIEQEIEEGNEYICVLNKKCYLDTANSKTQKVYSMEAEPFFYGEAHYYLGIMFRSGQGIASDKEKAEEHFKMAISYGSVKTE